MNRILRTFFFRLSRFPFISTELNFVICGCKMCVFPRFSGFLNAHRLICWILPNVCRKSKDAERRRNPRKYKSYANARLFVFAFWDEFTVFGMLAFACVVLHLYVVNDTYTYVKNKSFPIILLRSVTPTWRERNVYQIAFSETFY